MPKWGIEMSEGTVAEWMVAENTPFERGTVLTLIETDKITNEIEAEAPGCLVRLIARAGETYPVGALLAVLGDSGTDPAAIDAFVGSFKGANASFGDTDEVELAPPAVAGAVEPAPDSRMISPAAFVAASAAGLDIASIAGTGRGGRISLQDVHQATRQAPTISLKGAFELIPIGGSFASPMARRLAALHGVDLAGLKGTGPRGRICKADVLAAADIVVPLASSAAEAGLVIEAMSKMRRTIARRLTLSKSTIPHFYVRQRVRADRLMAVRAGADPRPSLNDYLIRACALALRQVPALNIQVHGDDIHRLPTADIAVAVATDGGLITPIVTAACQRSAADIATVMRDLGTRAKAGRLKQEEFEGGSFSLSNLGMFGVEQFDAIINPPHGAILAVGAARPEPMADDGAIRIVPMLHLSLSCDHRAIDGADAGRFMMTLVALLEAPETL
ncbi:2-oxo acid dehydrogenase subunit E2 [Sphingomonas sp. 28-63-12]|uniref:2-oxo acid dehydrogenase subunit E2 n=1 Tax=Sphingomonas sp. 28-63-12 TaxID=1970434 RepID=UPI0035A8C790